MKKDFLRYLATVCLLLAAVTMTAANRLYIKDFAIKPGETKIVEVYMQNDAPVRGVEMVVALPDGLTLDPQKAVLTPRADGHTLSGRATSKGYRLLAFSADNNAFAGNDGALIELTITASDLFTHSADIQLSEIIMEDVNGNALLEMATSKCEAYIIVEESAPNPTDNQPDDTF